MGNRFSPGVLSGLLMVGSLCLLTFHLGTPSLFESSEARYGSVARAMVDSGNWLIPHQNGLPHFTKPPLTYWCSAIGMKLFGISEFGAKAFLPLTGALTVLGTYRLGLLLLDPRSALCGAFVLMTSPLFLGLFRGLTTDPLLTMLATLMVWSLVTYLWRPTTAKAVYFWTLLGLILLTKGPPGFLPLLGILPAIWLSGLKRDQLKGLLLFPPGWVLFLIIGLGWYLVVAWKTPGLVSYFLKEETLRRLASEDHQRGGPIYYFLGVFLLGLFPWSPISLEAIWKSFGESRPQGPVGFSLRILLAWLLIPLIVLSLSQSKLATYFLPYLVPAALLTGKFLSRILHLGREEPIYFQVGGGVSMCFLGILGLAAVFLPATGHIPSRLMSDKLAFLGLHFLFLSAFCLVFWSFRLAKGALLAFGMAVPGMLFILLPRLEGNEEVWANRYLNGHRALLTAVGKLSLQQPIVCVEEQLEGLPFYSGRAIPTWEVKRETRFAGDEARDLVLFGPESLTAITRQSTYLLMRRQDVAKVAALLNREILMLQGSGIWGLYRTGALKSSPFPPPPVTDDDQTGETRRPARP